MEGTIKECYAKDGRPLQELVQEWIDENSSFLYCILQEKMVENARVI